MNKKAYREKAEKLYDYFNESEHDNYDFEVNVKRHSDYVDIDELIKKQEKKYHKKLKEFFDEDTIYSTYNFWLEYECKFLLECLNDNVDEDDKKSKNYIARQAIKDVGFSGRSGGYVVFNYNDEYYLKDRLEEIINETDESMYDGEKYTLKRIIEVIDETEKEVEKIEYIKTWIENFNKGLNFADELQFRIEEQLETIDNELKTENAHAYQVRKAKENVNKSDIEDKKQVLQFIK